jgi:hypothetical protein
LERTGLIAATRKQVQFPTISIVPVAWPPTMFGLC